MKKKIISALMVGVMCVSVFAFAGCSSSGSGSSGDTIKIGALGPYTGDTAMYGVAAKNGIELAAEPVSYTHLDVYKRQLLRELRAASITP